MVKKQDGGRIWRPKQRDRKCDVIRDVVDGGPRDVIEDGDRNVSGHVSATESAPGGARAHPSGALSPGPLAERTPGGGGARARVFSSNRSLPSL